MEPGDLRINSRLRDDSGVPKHSSGHSYPAANEGNSVLHFRSHVRPAVITDGRMHHASQMSNPHAPLMLDRNEPVKVWRDPSLMNSGEIRHVVSMQHSGVVHLTHPPHLQHGVNTSANVYQQHHDNNKPIDTTSRLIPHSTADSLRGRAPVVYAHPQHPSNNVKHPPPDNWRPPGGPGPGAHQNSKQDFRVNLTAKSTVEQAVHDHFVESLRLAQLKGNTQQPPVVKPEEHHNSHPRFYPPPQDKRMRELPSPHVIYQAVHPQLGKPELPNPPPLRSEPQYRTGSTPENSRKHQIYGPPEVITRNHELAQQQHQQHQQQQQQQQQHHQQQQQNHHQQQQQQQQSSISRYEQEAMSRLDAHPSDNCVRYQKLPPAPRRPTPQSELQLERNRSPFGKHAPPSASPNSYHMYQQQQHQQAHMNKHKVSSPAPPHIYGNPGPGSRPYDMVTDPSIPLSLTSKGGLTRPSQSSPTSYSHPGTHGSPTLPQHDVRKSDVAYYMYNNGPPGFQPSISPQAHIHSMQTQPLDLGGKRKMEEDSIRAYKGPTHPNDYADQMSNKSMYGSRKALEEHNSKISAALNLNYMNSSVPLSLTVSEVPSKRKNEDAPLPMHLSDTKKIKSESGGVMGGTSNLMIVRKEQHDVKPPIPEYITTAETSISRHYYDNPGPMSLTVPGAGSSGGGVGDVKPKVEPLTSSPSAPLDVSRSVIMKSGASIEASSGTPPVPPASSPLCNGKLKEATNMEITSPVVKVEPKLEVETNIAKAPEPSASTSSTATLPVPTSSSTPTTSSSSSSAPSKFQKVPKKAWVLQWHEGDNGKSEDTNNKVADNNSVNGTQNNNAGNSGNGNGGGGGGAASNPSPQEKGGSPQQQPQQQEDNAEKLPNGHVAANNAADGEPRAGPSNAVNGFAPRQNNESDANSENESDNSNKDRAGLDDRKGRKGKLPPKPDLRKDGLCKRPPVTQLKKTGESFIQAETCNRVTPKIGKCRECRWHPAGRGSKKQSGAYCRFYGFRKLRYTKGGSLTVAGFSDPFHDPTKITEHDQFRLWLPSNVPPEGLDVAMSKFVLAQLCDQFCDLVRQEEEAKGLVDIHELSSVAWKPLLKGVLEMCDVCDTTLFNFHWACGKCGFVVCLSCFKSRQRGTDVVKVNVAELAQEVPDSTVKDRDEYQWLLCSNRCNHELDKLMLVQTIPGDALTELNKKVHKICDSWQISQNCKCKPPENKPEQASDNTKAELSSEGNNNDEKNSDSSKSAEATTSDNNKNSDEKEVEVKNNSSEENSAASPKANPSPGTNPTNSTTTNGSVTNGTTNTIADELQHFKRSASFDDMMKRKIIDFSAFTATETNEMFPNIKHEWLCNGKVLRLLEAQNPENVSIFHEAWKRGLPVVVSGAADKLDKALWTPDSLCKDFGDYKNDLVNCLTGEILPNQQMRKFWDGFTCVSKRMEDEEGTPMLLKLKDWPPSDDFAQLLPSRFDDLMNALPLPDYTLHEGRLNLASTLPPEFMKPDLGPKMYIAYGSGICMDKGTTNLHLELSDVVNILVYSEGPETDKEEHEKAVIKALEESDCDATTMSRVKVKKEVPGALWHVYDAMDADKIRDLLNKVANEKGESKVEPHHDAIHDQSWYLDKKLRARLQSEYNVSGYSILQCAGDAVFIPAGAPHQVRNLQNCIKVAEEFVSPENISHSLYLAEEEYRTLIKTQTNHEDRLQIKNVVYHAVKDALTVLLLQNNEKSEVHQNTSNDASVASTTALSKDCQFQPSTSPKELAPVVVNTATN